jgi:hypothetical protein
MNALDTRSLQLHVSVLGWLYLLFNASLLFTGIVVLLFLGGIGVLVDDPFALRILSFVGVMGLVLFTVLSLPGLAAGLGLLRRRHWGRTLALVVGILGLVAFPIGTVLGLYAFFVLLQEQAGSYFDHHLPKEVSS